MKPLGFSIEQIRDLLGAFDTLADPASGDRDRAAAHTLVHQTHATPRDASLSSRLDGPSGGVHP
ncbi:hypothetical protein BJF82_13465 [Kytococcus sp. CUA-901]|nr:hypothetical protein BJF82_13465 [Kytococcus sp. CUA-901]